MKVSEQVRSIQFAFHPDDNRCKDIGEMADKIDQFRAENEKFRKALQLIANVGPINDIRYAIEVAKVALEAGG